MRIQRWPVALVSVVLFCFASIRVFCQSANDGFDPNVDSPTHNDRVFGMAVQDDGKILIGGVFNSVGGIPRTNIARLNVDGSVDLTFNPGADYAVFNVAPHTDGKILVTGLFTNLAGQPRLGIGRLNADGSLDTTFSPIVNAYVRALLVQRDGKVLIGGRFTVVDGEPRIGLARLNTDGTIDRAFERADATYTSASLISEVYSFAEQADGRIVVGGAFDMLSGQTRRNIGRLNPDGSLDLGFNPGALGGGFVRSLAIQPDGKILVGGSFSSLGSRPRINIGRLDTRGLIDNSFPGEILGNVYYIAIQANGKILVAGEFHTVSGQARSKIARLNADGSLDTFNPGSNLRIYRVAEQSDGKILACGDFNALGGANRNHIGRLYADGSLDATLDPGEGAQVYNVALQPNGKIIVAGYFTNIFGEPHQNIVRLNAGGSVDHSFTAEADYYVLHVALQTDGKILLAGGFTNLNGQLRQRIGRLNPDGTLDSAFDPGVDNRVDALLEQPDGKILVAGNFRMIAGQTRTNIARLNSDGTLDAPFNPYLDYDWAWCLALQSDGKILVGGQPPTVTSGEGRPLVRLLADGGIDSTFNPSFGRNSRSIVGEVECLAIQPDGKIVWGGWLSSGNSNSRTNLGRLNPDGSVDDTFSAYVGSNPSGLSPDVLSVAVQADGRIMVGGYFNTLNGETRNLIARLNWDGSLDNSFVPGHSGAPLGWSPGIHGLAIQPDGKILVSGPFTELSAQPRYYLGRLTSGTVASQRLVISAEGTVATWLRGGSSPEVQQVIFEQSTDGTNYSRLGSGVRVVGGWKLSGLILPAGQNIYIRARGRTVGGSRNGSSGIIESVVQFWRLPPPFISSVQVLDGGVFQFSFTNRNAVLFSVLASGDVAAPPAGWENLGAPVYVGNGIYQFTDPGATNHARRFYQLRTP